MKKMQMKNIYLFIRGLCMNTELYAKIYSLAQE